MKADFHFPSDQQPIWLKMGQAMRRLNVCRASMRKYCQEGLVRAEKLPSGHWRIDQDSIDQLLRRSQQELIERVQSLML